MKYLPLLAIGGFLVLASSCNSGKKDVQTDTPKNYDAYNGSAGATPAPVDPNAMNVAPVTGTSTAGTPQPTTAVTPQTTTAAGMNPPHGQPNHRCDIPVGAPLNSPPGKTANTGHTTQAQPVPATKQVVTPVQSNTAPTAPGMNPPHGQPNHRCDIPVGSPLNSAPAKKAEAGQTSNTATPAVEVGKPTETPKQE
jgi:hypothetical protein